MARYIDADALITDIQETICMKCGIDDGIKCKSCGIDDTLDFLETARTADVVPKSEVDKWYHEYHAIKDELKQEKMYHRETEKLTDKYCAELQTAKTEVERLEKENEKLTINMNAYGLAAKRLAEENESLEIELENMRRNLGDAREGWNDAECEVERLRKALDEYEETSGLKQAKAEVAREIFEEIYKSVASKIPMQILPIFKDDLDFDAGFINGKRDALFDALVIIAELKKKHTGDQT